MTDFKSILLDLGYSNIKDNGKELRMRPLYRESGNDTVLSVRKDTGHFIDFSKSISGSFEYLIQLSLNLKNIEDAKKTLLERWSVSETRREHRPEVTGPKIFPKKYLTKMIPDHEYWINRGVSLETIKLFEGGVIKNGTMANRYVFPIFDSKRNLLGVTGRCLDPPKNKNIPKWLHKGRTSEWKYPLQVNHEIVRQEKEIFLVESIGDMLSLWEGSVKNVLIVFGLNLSPSMISLLIKLDPNKIFISFNNDDDNNKAGNKAALKVRSKLANYFDTNQLEIALPEKNDFGEMSSKEIVNWRSNLNK
jgi:DNA primase